MLINTWERIHAPFLHNREFSHYLEKGWAMWAFRTFLGTLLSVTVFVGRASFIISHDVADSQSLRAATRAFSPPQTRHGFCYNIILLLWHSRQMKTNAYFWWWHGVLILDEHIPSIVQLEEAHFIETSLWYPGDLPSSLALLLSPHTSFSCIFSSFSH